MTRSRKIAVSIAAIASLSPLAACSSAPISQPASPTALAYPNELSAYRFYEHASFRSLHPLEATMADVRRVLGPPDDLRDLRDYSAPYPGDDKAEKPVWTYESPEWHILVYFVKTMPNGAEKYPAAVQDRVYSFDLVPVKPLHFEADPAATSRFVRQLTKGADAGWYELSDGSGLVYQVYTSKTPYGHQGPGDINRIVYGPPK